MKINQIIQALDSEILWCEQNPDPAFHAQYRKGFANGLIQAKYIIAKMVRDERAAKKARRRGGGE